MILYRPVGLQELALIYDSGMKVFPARLPQQPIFYPVLDLEYARQTASGWNAKNGELGGYVTQFKVDDSFIEKFETHQVGKSQYQELWIPTDEMEEFNKHIVGHIKVIEGHFGEAFEGFIPEQFGLAGKNAVEQFTLLANSYLYKRMEFYLEIKRNHKAVFLNYPFWQVYEFKNPGLKEKIIQAIKEAWLTSFPKTPLPLPPPVSAETPPVVTSTPAPLQRSVRTVEKEAPLEEPPVVKPLRKDPPPARQVLAPARALIDRAEEGSAPTEPIDLGSSADMVDEESPQDEQAHTPAPRVPDPVDEEDALEDETGFTSLDDLLEEEEDLTLEDEDNSESLDDLVEEEPTPLKQTQADVRPRVNPIHEEITPPKRTDVFVQHFGKSLPGETTPANQTDSHFVEGVRLGLSGKYPEAIEQLSRAVKENPGHVVAHTSLGVALRRLGEEDRALASYAAALKRDPKDAEAHYFRANILYSQGDVRQAIVEYTFALGLKPELITAHEEPAPGDRLTDYARSPAEIYRIAKPAQRILELNKLIEVRPQEAKLFKERASVYSRLWNYEQAIADYKSSLALQPEDGDALHLRGVAYEQLGQLERAQQDYQKAAAINSQLAAEYIQRGVTFGNMGNLRQSIASFTEGIRLAPQNPDSYFNRGTAYFQLGDFERAIEDFSHVLRLAPGDEGAYYWRGISHEEAGRQREAIADYRQFLSLSQNAQARNEIERKLRRWNVSKQENTSRRNDAEVERQAPKQVPSGKPEQKLDLHGLVAALGERALRSTWFGGGVECYGEKAEELYAFTEQDKPMEGQVFLSITAGIHQTIKGDFFAFDPGTNSHWLFMRAWEGSGFYVETNDAKIKKQLMTQFSSVEDVEEVSPPYEGLFIPITPAAQ